MHVTLVHVHVKREYIDDFIAVTRANHLASVLEHGNRRFDVLQLREDGCRFVLYEAYVSTEDATSHKQTTHYLAWRDTVAPWMAEPRQGISYQALCPEA